MLNVDWTEVLIQYQGVFGTVLGSVCTFIVTSIMNRSGRIKIYVNSIAREYRRNDGPFNEDVEVQSVEFESVKDKIRCSNIKLDIDVFNSALEDKSLRKLTIIGLLQNGNKINLEIKDDGTGKFIACGMHYEDLKIINIPSRQMVNFKLHCYVPQEYLLDKIEKLYLEGISHNGKMFKKVISRGI